MFTEFSSFYLRRMDLGERERERETNVIIIIIYLTFLLYEMSDADGQTLK